MTPVIEVLQIALELRESPVTGLSEQVGWRDLNRSVRAVCVRYVLKDHGALQPVCQNFFMMKNDKKEDPPLLPISSTFAQSSQPLGNESIHQRRALQRELGGGTDTPAARYFPEPLDISAPN